MKNNNKQTAVEILENFLLQHCNPTICNVEWSDFKLAIEQAKDMFQEQIQDAWTHGAEHWDVEMEGNDYYNETFGDSK